MDLAANRPRLPALTSLRFFAALHVVTFHLYSLRVTTGPAWYRNLSSIGYVGVDLFFVLSGFILVYTYAGRPWTAGRFWRARFARIYPAYLFSLLVTAPSFFYACLLLKNADPSFTWFAAHPFVSWLSPPALLQAWIPHAALAWNSPAWSLSDEAFFYAIFPFVVTWLARKSGTKLAAWALLAWLFSLSIASGYAIFKPDGVMHVDGRSPNLFWLDVVKFHPLARVPEFLAGVCLGFLFLRNAIDRRRAALLILCGVSCFAVVVAFGPYIPYTILHDSLLTPAFAAIIYGVALRPRWVKVLEVRPLELLGDASYSLYLLHNWMIAAYFGPSQNTHHRGVMDVLVGIVIMAGVSVAAYLYIEQPARRWLRPKEAPLPIAAEAANAS